MKKLLIAFFALACLAGAQEALTNESIVKMVKAGLAENLILTMIQNQPGNYTMTPDELVKLKGQGISDGVMTAMMARASGPAAAPSAPALGVSPSPAAILASGGDLPQGIDIGVYYKKQGKWEEMLPEVVNWKTGGVIKHVASAGIVKGDVNGRINGAHSRNSAASPVEVLIYAPEGVAITEYQLIHLRDNQDAREFRTVTGGVLHESGGATRDVIPFEGTKVANRMYKVLLPSLGAGEFGFLPPGAVSSSSSASIGKMYTFRLVE